MRILVALAVLGLSAAVHGGQGDQRNAATWYRRAIERYEALGSERVQAVVDWAYGDTSKPPPPDVAAVLADAQGMLEDFRRGARCSASDFDLDYSKGFELLLPHLSGLRGIARVAGANALAQLQAGNAGAAALDISAIYRASAQVPNDRVLISGLVGQALFATADGLVDRALAQASLQPSELRTLGEALDVLPTRDPFQYAESVAMERMITMDWLPRLMAEHENPLEALSAIMGSGEVPLDLVPVATPEGMQAALEPYDAAMAEVQAAFEMDDPEAAAEAMKTIGAKVAAGEYGPLARVFMPAFGKILERRGDAEAMLAKRREMIAKMLGGELPLDAQLDAAQEYLRMIERLAALPPEQQVRLGGRAALDAEDDAAWTKLREGLDLASTRARCNFKQYRGPGALRIAPPETPGLRALLSLLLADAQRRFDAGEPDAAADRLVTVIAATAQWSSDDTVGVALVAHEAFRRAMRLVDDLRDANLIDDERRARLHAAVHRIPRRDPFGYVAATQALRDGVRGRLHQMAFHGGRIDDDLFVTIDATRGNANADEIVAMAATLEWMARETEPRLMQAIEASDALVPDLLDRDGLAAARMLAGAVGMHVAARNFDLRDGTIAWPVVAPLRERTYEARLDVRRAQRELGREE